MSEATTNLLSLLGVAGNSNTTGSSSNSQVSRTVGTAATIGLSLTILRFLISAATVNNNRRGGGDADYNDDGDDGSLAGRSEVLYQFVKSVLKRMLLLQSNNNNGGGGDGDGDDQSEDNVPIIHKGACHCRSVQFELIAPRKVACKAARPGKIQYRHARVRARSFRFIQGAPFVNMYYVNKTTTTTNSGGGGHHQPKGSDEVGAHSFCSRCGVHFLHAPNSHSSALDVNVDCLETEDIKLQATNQKMLYLSAGIRVRGQWGNQEGGGGDNNSHSFGYPATISEDDANGTPLKVLPIPNNSSPFVAGYNNDDHPLMRHHNNNQNSNNNYSNNRGAVGLDSFDQYDGGGVDDSTIDLVFPENEKMAPPGTPSTVRTSQTESFQSSLHNGVPPTLTLDTRDSNFDMESVISMTSARSCFPNLSSRTSDLQSPSDSSLLDDKQVSSAASAISPRTTALARLQMQKYMKKHMSSSSTMSTSVSTVSPKSRGLSN